MPDEIEPLLKRRLGLDAESIGSSAIARAVQERIAACKVADMDAYTELLASSEAELRHLTELLVVPETWFFRDEEAFAELTRFVLKTWLPVHPEGTLRLLSLPCSTGEEAYSMAMVLLDAGVPPGRFCINGVDVSEKALARARVALYGKNSFRNRDLGFRDRHFKATSEGWRLDERVARQVKFQPGNLIDEGLLPGLELYDIVFCRNLMIYFDRAAQDRAVGVLSRLLKTEGLLFVGPSETALVTGHSFVSIKVPLAFAFRKSESVAAQEHKKARHRPATQAPHLAPAHPAPKHEPAHSHSHAHQLSHTHHVAPPPTPITVDIDEALRFADQGRLAEAAQRCEDYIQAHGPSSKAFYLLGLIRDAAGEPEQATLLYRKALYLDPHHQEALVQLALLLDKQGDKAGAKVLNDRAARHAAKGKS